MLSLAAITPAKDKPRNLKVLPKDISEDSLYTIMTEFEHALGVKCGSCHVMKDTANKEDYASDALSNKETTRTMMRMTMDINKKYYGQENTFLYPGKVTCFTCHRGNPEPTSGNETGNELWKIKN